MKRLLFLYFALVFTTQILAQGEPNDCVNSVTVCGNGIFESTGSGIGNNQEVSGCGGFEHNSIWIKINIIQTGTLGFDLIPINTAISEDYDFWVYAPNALCGSLGSPIRCCTSNPTQSSSTNNHTGMYASTLATTSNYLGASYVRWLDVVAGQSYYICIDRPVGDDGFQLQWTGSATAGTGAFPPLPTANTIADVKTCSSVPNVGVFDLANVIPVINSDTVNNTVNFFDTIAEATDNIPGSELALNTYFNYANPQTVYARVTNNTTGCYSITSLNLVVPPPPTASMNVSSNSICSGSNVTVTFTGTPNATIQYTINNGSLITTTLDASGNFLLTETPTLTTTYKLVNVYSLYTSAEITGTSQCINAVNHSEIVTVNQIPSATITGTTAICTGSTATLTINGNPNAIVDYSVDTAPSATPITLNSAGIGTIITPNLTSNSTYTLTGISLPSSPACTKILNDSATITINAIPNASITGTTTICSGDSAPITFSGTQNATIIYNINGGTNQTINLGTTGTATIPNTSVTSTQTYNLISVTSPDTPSCTKSYTGVSAVITVPPSLIASISGTTTICSGSSATISFSGTSNAVVTYKINSGSNQTITLDASGVASLTPTPTIDSTYTLISVSLSGSCSQNLTQSATITVIATPTASISGATTICSGSSTPISFTGTPNAVVTYKINSGSNQTITLDATGNATLTPTLTTTTTYTLVSVNLGCPKNLSDSIIITVNAFPVLNIVSGTTTVCNGSSYTVVINGTPNAVVTFNVNSGLNQTITLDASGNGSFPNTNLQTSLNYLFTDVNLAGCNKSLSLTANVTVIPTPTATISGGTTICNGQTGTITISGTPNALVIYNINGGTNQNVTINSTGTNTITTSALTSNTTYNLVSVSIVSGITCSKNLTDFTTITVTPIPTVITTPATQTICSGQTTSVTLSSNLSTTTFSWTVTQTGATGASAGSGNSINQILTATGTTSGTVIYTITPTSNSCIGTTKTVTITVKPNPIVTATPVTTSICSGLNAIINISSNITGTTYSWTATATGVSGASNGSGNTINQILTATGTGTGNVVYTITPTVNSCPGSSVSVTIYVSPKPNVSATSTQNSVCSGNSCAIVLSSTESTTTFSWTVTQSGVSGATSGSGNLIVQSLIATGSTIGTVTYAITPTNNGCVGNSIIKTISVIPAPIGNATGPQDVCTGYTTEIILNSSLPNTTYTWTATQINASGASSGSGNEINQNLTVTSYAIGTVTYTITPSTNGCPGTPFTYVINVHPNPFVAIEDDTICMNPNTHLSTEPYTFYTGLDNTLYDFVWYLNGTIIPSQTNNTLAINQGGIYGVIATNSITGCESSIDTAIINESYPGESMLFTQTEMFAEDPTLVISVLGGNGTYTYQLDSGPTQFSNIIENVPAGEHLITVRDTNNCTYLTANTNLIGYPKYFTPNGDGYHDIWNIIGMNGLQYCKITIFDRFGKLIYQFSSASLGWNGTLNGEQLPASDYWFMIEYKENGIDKTFKSHFALKR